MSDEPTYHVYALKVGGPFVRSRALMLWLRDWDVQVEANHYIWLLRWGDKEVVVDAGVSPKVALERDLSPYSNPVDVLARVGVQAEAVRHVILTHLHWDHAAGVTLFPNATFYLQEEEFRFWTEDPISQRPPLRNPFISDESYKPYLSNLKGSDRLVLLQGDQEILPGIECILAPGHTPALQAVAVSTEEGTAIIGSDCAHMFDNYKEDWPSSLIFDMKAWMESYDKLRSKVSSPDLLFPGHDPLMTTNYPTIAKGVTRLV
jgi:glyoxylase-like metal-dependent hydrolase (beta-lactamase superfamily II)